MCGGLAAHLQGAVPFVSERPSPPADRGGQKLSKHSSSCALVNKPGAATASAAPHPAAGGGLGGVSPAGDPWRKRRVGSSRREPAEENP